MNKKPFTYIDKCPIYVYKRKRKDIKLEFHPDFIKATVPSTYSLYSLNNFFKEKKQYLLDNLKKVRKEYQYSNNETDSNNPSYVLIFGERWSLVPNNDSKIIFKDNKIYLPKKLLESDLNKIEVALDEPLKAMLQDVVQEELSKWEHITGLYCNGFSIRKMKTRWASVTINTAKMRFNFYLITQPKKVISYVALHELVHLKESNHQKGFYNLLKTYLPDYKKYQDRLKKVYLPMKYIY